MIWHVNYCYNIGPLWFSLQYELDFIYNLPIWDGRTNWALQFRKSLHILTGSSHGCFHPYTTAPYKTSYRNIYTNYMFPFNCILIYLISLISRSNELIVLRNSSIDACLLVEFCKNLTGHYYKNSLLSQFHRAICPGFGTGIRLPGQKAGGRTGTNVPHAKIFFAPRGIRSQDLLSSAWFSCQLT